MSVVDVPVPPPGRLGFARQADVDLFVERLEAFEKGEVSADETLQSVRIRVIEDRIP